MANEALRARAEQCRTDVKRLDFDLLKAPCRLESHDLGEIAILERHFREVGNEAVKAFAAALMNHHDRRLISGTSVVVLPLKHIDEALAKWLAESEAKQEKGAQQS